MSAQIESFETLLQWRRDVRHFTAEPIDEAVLARIFRAADSAPSVGLSQPWRVMRVDNARLRQLMTANFESENRTALAGYDGDKRQRYSTLKLAGFSTAPIHLAVFCDQQPQQGAGLGRQTMPEMLHYSCVCMIHTLWLAARAANVGMGWVSILNPTTAHADLSAPSSWQFIAYLLLGWPSQEHEIPELERENWEHRSAFELRWQRK